MSWYPFAAILHYKGFFNSVHFSSRNITYYYHFEAVKEMKGQETSKYIRHYCCLYHFSTGKAEKASSPCYNHVPLGIINPPPSTHSRSPKPSASSLRMLSKAQSINYHTHDINEIERKMSLPKRLAYPRLYVEQITKKNQSETVNPIATYQAFLKKKQFQEIFLLFKSFAKATGFKSELDVVKSYTKFANLHQIFDIPQSSPQVCFAKAQFRNYLVELGITEQQAAEFWNVAFSQGRFLPNGQGIESKTGVVSMKAFAYNFRKFYLEEIYSFKNCLSEAALRQRLIDLRLFLEPWFERNIIFKYNHQQWKEQELQCCAQLKRYNQTTIYAKILSMIELRNKIWLFMRTLSKLIYQITDQKNVGLAVFNDKATAFIQKQTNNLAVWAEFVDQFENHLVSTGKSREEPFKITDLLQFSKGKFPDRMEEMLCYLRGIFKYLYFFNKSPLLSLNQETLNIDCKGIAQVTFELLLEFLDYKRRETNHLMDMVESVCCQVNETVEARPEVNGHKSFLNECNFLAEALLKMIKRCDFSVFSRLQLIRHLYLKGDISDTIRLKLILEQNRENNDGSEIKETFWKNMFSFHSQPIIHNNESLAQSGQVLQKNYQAALEAYEELRKRLEGKLPSQSQDYEKKQKIDKSEKRSQPEREKSEQKFKVHEKQRQQHDPVIQSKHSCFDSAYCSLCDEICSTSLNSSLHRIDSMSDYILDMLRDV